jgi:hypothetical protein
MRCSARKRRGSWRRCRSWPGRSGSDSRLGSPRHRPRPRSRTNNRNQGARAPRPRYNSHQGAREGSRSQGHHRSRSQLKTSPSTVSASSITASSSPELGPFLFSGVSRYHETLSSAKNSRGRTAARKLAAEYFQRFPAEYFQRFPKERYETEVESWREHCNRRISNLR